MKRLATPLLTAALIVSPGAAAFGQTTLTVTAGVSETSIGIDMSRFSVSHFDFYRPTPNFEPATGITIGLAVTVPFSERLGLQLGGRYVQKGSHWRSWRDGFSFESGMESEYVELATQLKGRFPLLGDRLSAYATAGPAVAFKTSCDWNEVVTIMGAFVSEISASCARVGLGLGDFDFGLSGGTGVEIWLSESMGVSVGVAYTLGLLNVATSRTSNFKNRAMAFRFGIVTPIG